MRRNWCVLSILTLALGALAATPARAAALFVTKTADTADGACDADRLA